MRFFTFFDGESGDGNQLDYRAELILRVDTDHIDK